MDHAQANLLAGVEAGNIPDRRMVQRSGIDGSLANADYFRSTLPSDAQRYLGDRPFAAKTLAQVSEASDSAATAYEALCLFSSRVRR